MTGNAEGHKKYLEAMVKRYGSIEAWKDHQRQVGIKGGSVKNPKKGFGSNQKLARYWGRNTKGNRYTK